MVSWQFALFVLLVSQGVFTFVLIMSVCEPIQSSGNSSIIWCIHLVFLWNLATFVMGN